MTQMRLFYRYTVITFLILLPLLSSAQSYSGLLKKAETYHNEYDFDKAIDVYNSILESISDSTERYSILRRIALSENGGNMLQYIASPTVLASKTVPRRDFYLHYSHLDEHSWIPFPNAFVPYDGGRSYNALYFNDSKVFFSMQDDGGKWHIHYSTLLDNGEWSAPQAVNPGLISSENEIYPLPSYDGRSLYFSSNGLYGMGGYDIFVSHWDEEAKDWGEPENMGFPFSSPYDDLLYSDSPDGNFTVFASNRDCSPDSVKIYVLAFENSPIRHTASSLEEIRSIAHLNPVRKEETVPQTVTKAEDTPKDPLYGQYVTLIRRQKAMSDSLERFQSELNRDRGLYNTISDGDKPALLKVIRRTEENSIDLQMRMGTLSDELQMMSLELLQKGIAANPEEILSSFDAPKEVPAARVVPQYSFEARSFGTLDSIIVQKPEPKIDYTFRILDEAVIVEDNTLPKGIVYQIRIMVAGSKVPLRQLKGLSPIFEVKQPSGKYVYSVGLFFTHKEAQSQLPKVKGRGFSQAYIVAYSDGKGITAAKAKELEAKESTNEKYRIILSGYESGLPDNVMKIISDNCSKDIIRSVEDGETIYVIAPFTGSRDAESLAIILKDNGISGVSIRKIE